MTEIDEIKATLQAVHAQVAMSPHEVSVAVTKCVTFLIVDMETSVINCASEIAEQMFGYIPGELLGKSVNDLVPDGLRAKHSEHMQFYAREPVPRQMGTREMLLQGKRKDGQLIKLEISLHPYCFGGRRCVVVVLHHDKRSSL